MRERRLVIASNSCWYAYNFRLALIKALIERSWKVTVVAPRDMYAAPLAESGAAHYHVSLEPKGTNVFREVGLIRAFYLAYREIAPAISLQHTIKPNIYGSLAARLAGIPVVNTITGLGTAFSGGLRERLVRKLSRYAFRGAELNVFQNADDLELFLKHRIVRPDRIAVLPGSGVDTNRFSPQPRGGGPFTFSFVGRLLRAKGAEDFVEAARRVKDSHPQTRFLLLGSHDPADADYADPRKLMEALDGGIVEMHGHVDDVRPFLAASDCVVLPSYYREGVPRSLLEAASMGKPLIAADSVGTREPVLEGRNGFLCRPRDPLDLAAKMEAMLTMPAERRSSMGAASRSYTLERFDERLVTEAYLAAVERISTRADA